MSHAQLERMLRPQIDIHRFYIYPSLVVQVVPRDVGSCEDQQGAHQPSAWSARGDDPRRSSASLGSASHSEGDNSEAETQGGRLVLSDEVEHALAHRLPIIALESTIISHGMPQPTNLDTALSVENIIRTAGVTPATIALLDGNVHVGLSQAQLERLADLTVKGTVKVSRRDMAPVLAQRLTGGTTVAGTMVVAHSVGIGMFVTGGIGGVHRGAEKSLDVSADLTELGRTPVAVVCAGAKSILDIPKTLEYLETQGVCVATYALTPDFPAFYSPKSGLKSPWHVQDATSAAALIRESRAAALTFKAHERRYIADTADASEHAAGRADT